MSQIVDDACESWDLTPPVIPPRSRLTCLKPVGIGTAFVESLTSYITRLADAHSVAVESIFGIELVPLINRPYLNHLTKNPRLMFTFHRTAHSLNGKGVIAEDCSAALESLTLRNELRFLTMITWRHLLTYKALLRKTRAWCPKCYNEQIESKSPVYDQLLWALQEVTVCQRHFIKLEITCPLCEVQSQPFTRKMRAGLCNSCGGWLGSVREINATEEVKSGADLYERIKTTTLIGEMLAAAPYLKKLLSKESFASTLRNYTNQLPPNSLDIFAKLIKTTPGLASKLVNGGDRIRLGVLVRICKVFDSSVIDFLNGNNPVASPLLQRIHSLNIEKVNKAISLKIEKKNRIKRYLQAALNSPSYPTVTDLSRQLGYKSPKSLWYISAELCKKIVAKNKAKRPRMRNKECAPEIGPKNSFYPDHVRLVLVEAVSEEPPPTVKDVALRVGFKADSSFRTKYPDVTKLLMNRRKEYVRAEYSKLKDALLAALKEEPPPSLREVCGRLTYKDKPFKWVQSLFCKFPALCRAVSARHNTYRCVLSVSNLSNFTFPV